MDSYLLLDKSKNKRGEDTTEFKECEGHLIIKHFTGINTDNFIIKKLDGKKLCFSFFKVNGVHYVNINGEHIIDYKRFTSIQFITKLSDSSIKIINTFIGELILENCDTEMFQKALSIMSKHMKGKSSYFGDLMYLLFN
jgi:hypothetical protein